MTRPFGGRRGKCMTLAKVGEKPYQGSQSVTGINSSHDHPPQRHKESLAADLRSGLQSASGENSSGPLQPSRESASLWCPQCGTPLVSEAGGSEPGFHEFDVLTCRCSSYPIVARIPILKR